MAGVARAVPALFLLVGPVQLQAQLQAQPASRQADVRLEWRSGWTDTGIVVARGDTLTIRVRPIRGEANDRRAQEQAINPATGANANPRQEGREPLADILLKAAARRAIVGRIGQGPQFAIGRAYRQAVKAGGALSLRWNVPRELAGAAPGFDVAVRVEPAPPAVEVKPDPPRDPAGNATGAVAPLPTGEPPVGEEPLAPPPVEEGNSARPEGNSVQPVPAEDPPSDREPGGAAESGPLAANGAETGRPAAALPVGGGIAALLLLLAAAGVGVRRRRRRKLVNRTRSLLALSPSLDLGEGACRGGSLPAEGPAASLRARLEEGAVRIVEGGGNG
jgi:hypothetical protein